MTLEVAVDLDGTISAAPLAFCALMQALKGDGVRVTVLTGNHTASTGYLAGIGVTQDAYDQIVVLPDTTLPMEKAAWCAANDVTVVIDNKGSNCMSCVAAGVALALLPVTPETVKAAQRKALMRSRRLLDD